MLCYLLIFLSLSLSLRQLFTTCYMGTTNSSLKTRQRAQKLADQIGRYLFIQTIEKYSFFNSRHFTVVIDDVVTGCLSVFEGATQLSPKFKVHGGSQTENLALQNVQVLNIYMMSELL